MKRDMQTLQQLCEAVLAALLALLAQLAQRRNIRMLYAFQSAASIVRQVEQQNPTAVVAAEQDFSPELREVLQRQGIAGIALEEMDARASHGCATSRQAAGTVSIGPQIEILTSGTTGTPKPFPISYAMIAKFMVGENLLTGESALV